MSVALWDAVILSRHLNPKAERNPIQDLSDWDAIRPHLAEWQWERKGVASTVNTLAMSLYDLFSGQNEKLAVLREGCFAYFQKGGDCTSVPLSIIAALNPRPHILFYHFFRVTFLAIYLIFVRASLLPGYSSKTTSNNTKIPITNMPARIIFSLQVFWTAVCTLLPVIWGEISA